MEVSVGNCVHLVCVNREIKEETEGSLHALQKKKIILKFIFVLLSSAVIFKTRYIHGFMPCFQRNLTQFCDVFVQTMKDVCQWGKQNNLVFPFE